MLDEYNYKLISKEEFDKKYLLCKEDGSIYKNYVYKDKYNIEKIISSCTHFDSDFDELYYYNIDGIITFIKYKTSVDMLNDNEKVKEILNSKGIMINEI